MTIEFSPIDLRKAFANPPQEGYIWDFSGETTWLQTDSVRDGEIEWYLTKKQDDNPQRYVEVENSAKSILEALGYAADRAWTADKGQLLEAMLPAIRVYSFGL